MERLTNEAPSAVRHEDLMEALEGLGIDTKTWTAIRVEPDAIILERRVEVLS